MTPAFEIREGSIRAGGRDILHRLHLVVEHGGITALVGPVGGGKTSLVSALAGAPAGAGVERSGEWNANGEDLRRHWAEGSRAEHVKWIAQPRRKGLHDRAVPSPGLAPERWREALGTPRDSVIADEPFRFVPDAERDQLEAALVARAEQAAVLLVTHDVSLLRRIASRVCLLVAGRIDCDVAAPVFFEAPPTPLAVQFIRQGNCWPRNAVEAPRHFHWLLPERLAGMGEPGLTRDRTEDLDFLVQVGITHVLSLTEYAPPRDELARHGLQSIHLPVRDMGVPSIHAAAGVCRAIERAIDAGGRVAVHCRAGLGRTGTMLAAFLVWSGAAPACAIDSVRAVSPSSIQNRSQEQFVARFAESVGPSS